jgi:hypothetical protein
VNRRFAASPRSRRASSSSSSSSASPSSRVRAAATAMVESLELRRFLSATPLLVSEDTGDMMGSAIALKGDLALIGARQSDPFNDPGAGKVVLVNTVTQAIIRTFDSPDNTTFAQFGGTVAWMGDSILIRSHPGYAQRRRRLILRYRDRRVRR